MPTRSGAGLAVAVALGVLSVLPAGAQAATTTLTFEEFAAGIEIDNEYKDAGGTDQGVIFGQGPTGPNGPLPQVRTVPAGQAQSGTKVADLCDGCGTEFSTTYTYGKFTYGKKFVRVYVGTPTDGFNATLEAYNASGSVIDTDTKPIKEDAGYHTLLETTAPSGQQIAFFRVRPPSTVNSGSVFLYIDDVQFDTPDPPPPGDPPPPPPPPDFGLAIDPNQIFGDALSVAKGESASLQILINRINNSAGPLSFAATGLPPNVTASFTPDNASNPTKVTATFTASENAGSATKTPVTITATPTAKGSSENDAPRSIDLLLSVLLNYDLQVLGIEVTQGIQTVLSNTSTLPSPATPGTVVEYEGVHLVAGSKTFARVFANLTAPTNGQVEGVPMLLYGSKQSGGSLPGSPLVATPRTLSWSTLDAVDYVMRASQGNEYAFVLPRSWTKGTIKLEAKTMPPDLLFGPSVSECETAACAQNNSFKLNNIPFQGTGSVRLGVYSMYVDGEPELPPPKEVLADAVEITPLATHALKFDPNAYVGSVDITDVKNATTPGDLLTLKQCKEYGPGDPTFCSDPITSRFRNTMTLVRLQAAIMDWITARQDGEETEWDQVIGINWSTAYGLSTGAPLSNWPHAVAKKNRPLSSIGHELHHGFGRDHASECTNGSDPGTTEDWPPDQQGFIQGIGLDRRAGANGPGSDYKVIAPRSLSGLGSDNFGDPDFVADDYYDLMSYCATPGFSDYDSWSSTRGWDITFDDFRDFLGASSARARAARLVQGMHVSGFAFPGQPLLITGVNPGMVPRDIPGTPTPGLELELENAMGQTLARAPVMTETSHGDPDAGVEDGPVTFVEANVPTSAIGAGLPSAFAAQGGVPSSVQGLQITANGSVVASTSRTAHVPKVAVRRPGKGDVVGRKRNVTVRWRATDADKDPLDIRIDYSSDDGRNWQGIWFGPNRGKVKLPSRFFAGSRRARIQVSANDGFDATVRRSARFRAVGRPPTVLISSPARRERVSNDAVLNLAGDAYDDAGVTVPSRRLRWFDGRRRLGRGARISVRNLEAGKHRIRLVARDRTGRRGAAKVRIRVVQAEPQFLTLVVPQSVGTGTRSMQVRVASTVPARLRVSGESIDTTRARVSRRARTVTVPVTPGETVLNAAVRLSAGGKSTQLVATVPRG